MGYPYPSIASLKALSDAAHRLEDAIERYDKDLARRPIRDVQERGHVLLNLCDAIHAIWDVNDDGDILLGYCDVEGYGHAPRTLVIADDFAEIAMQLRQIGEALRFEPMHDIYGAWEWRFRGGQGSLFEEAELPERDGELLAWWAPPDSVDDAVSRFDLSSLPDRASFWQGARANVERMNKDGSPQYSAIDCLAALYFGDRKIVSVGERQDIQAFAIEWARRRRPRHQPGEPIFREPQRDAFGRIDEPVDNDSEFNPASWGTGLFDGDESWPVLDDEVEECGSNIRSAAYHAYEYLRGDEDVDRGDASTNDEQQTVATTPDDWAASLPAPPSEWRQRLKRPWNGKKGIKATHRAGELRGRCLSAQSWIFSLDDLKRLFSWEPTAEE